ncbi:MAG TPA: glycosyltransferase [Nocardioidaceae bacterium]|nr:glycosyltransferase [Nocardioidaceae bacterium]
MRVLHVVEVSHGGVVSLVRTFAALQASAQHEVHVLAPSEAPRMDAVHHAWRPVRRSPRRLLAARRTLRRVVLEVRPDVVHLHSFFPGLLGRTGGTATAAVVYQPHSWAFQAVGFRPAGRLAAVWESLAMRRTDVLVTNCRDEIDEAARVGISAAHRARVIGTPVDTERYRPTASGDRSHLRAQLGLGARYVLVCVGRLSRQKGQVRLAEVWEHEPVPETLLVLVGPGDPEPVRRAAPTTFGRSLLHVGAQEDVRPWLWAADVCVQPSLYEGQSVAMAEALACGVPVVITAVNGAMEAVVGHHGTPAGGVVPVGDFAGVLEQAAALLSDPRHRAAAAASARSRAEDIFAQSQVLARLDEAYLRALEAASSH